MSHTTALRVRRLLVAFAIGAFSFTAPALRAQQTPSPSPQEPPPGTAMTVSSASPWEAELKKYPGLADELAILMGKLMQDVHFPPARNESRLLPLAPSSSVAYAALPNYGDAVSQTLAIFHQELAASLPLRNWWQHGSPATAGPKILDGLEKIAQFYQFLGPELVASCPMEGTEPQFIAFSEVRKPGLKLFLQQWNQELADKSKSKFRFRVLEPKDLSTAADTPGSDEVTILLRPDFIASADKIATLRAFNSHLDAPTRDFPNTPFAQRLLAEYHDGVTSLAAVDIQRALEKAYPVAKQSPAFKQSGFAESQYLVWDHKLIANQPVSQLDLSFSGPRHGAAAWLAEPAPLDSIDFVSPNALMVFSMRLSSAAQIFDDFKSFSSNPNSFEAISAGEQALGLNLKEDLLNLLTGELTAELDAVDTAHPAWHAFIGVSDPAHLSKTLSTLITVSQTRSESAEKGDLTFTSIEIPNKGAKPTQLSYTFADGYLIVGPTIDTVAGSVQLHRSGASLGKSKKYLDTIPPGHTAASSALFYEDPSYIANLRFGSFLPQLSESLKEAAASETTPSVAGHFYADKSAIREISSNAAFDAAGALVVAAIAIPNLMRSRVAANEASAIGTVRVLNVAQVTYSATYPDRNFAPNILSFGFNIEHPGQLSPDHAEMVSDTIAGPTCGADGWCTKSGYRFRIDSTCKANACTDYIVLATPVSSSTGTRSFCSTSDGIIRYQVNERPAGPVSIAKCKTWTAF